MKMSIGKAFKKVTSILLIVAMVVTSAGIQTFASSIDNVVSEAREEKGEENLNRKYYDDLINSQKEEESDEKADDDESIGVDASVDEEPEEDEETSDVYEEEPEEDTTDDGESGDDSSTDDSEFVGPMPIESDGSDTEDDKKESEESSSISDTENDDNNIVNDEDNIEDDIDEKIASESDASTDADIEDTTDAEATDDAEANDADANDADANGAEASPSDADDTDKEKVATIATYSEVFTVATRSELFAKVASDSELLPMEASASEFNDLLGGFNSISAKKSVPTYIVYGDVGYDDTGRQSDQGYIGFYLGKDEIGHTEYLSADKHNVTDVIAPHYTKLWNGADGSAKQLRASMLPPEFYYPVSWYVRTGGKAITASFWNSHSYADRMTPDEFREQWAKNGPGSTTNYLTLHGIDCWREATTQKSEIANVSYISWTRDDIKKIKGAEYDNKLNYQDRNFLTRNQNIRGFVISGDDGSGNYTLRKVSGVKFNNNWDMKEVESMSAWHVESMDDEITVQSSQNEEYDWHMKFKSSYYGIHVGQAHNDIETTAFWRRDGWKSSNATTKISGYADGQTLRFRIPDNTKDVKYTDSTGTYKLVGWTLEPNQFKYIKNYDDDDDDDLHRRIAYNLNESLKTNYTTNRVWKPGDEVSYTFGTSRWPLTFGPFYRQRRGGEDHKGNYLRDGDDFGMADKGANCVESYGDGIEDTWSMITKVRRGNDERDQFNDGDGVQYNVLFLSPVLKKENEVTLTLDPQGGTWTEDSTTEEKTITYSNFVSKNLPTSIEREGYIFGGWYTKKNGQGTGYTKVGEPEANAGLSYLYAKWIERTYSIQIKANNPKGSDGVVYGTYTDGEVTDYNYTSTITMPKDTAWAVADFNLLGYSKEADAKTAEYEFGKEYNISDMVADNAITDSDTNVLYPIYKEKEVIITFYGGRKLASDNLRKENTNKVEKTYPFKTIVEVPQDFTLTGFNFKGFNKDNESDTVTLELSEDKKKTAVQFVTTYGMKEGKLDFYAVWKEKEYSIAIDAGTKEVNGRTYKGAGSIASKSYAYHSNITMPNTPTIRGFKLIGFSKDDNQDEAKYSIDDTVDIKDLVTYLSMEEYTEDNKEPNTLYAVYEITSATLTFNADIGAFASNGKRKITLKVPKAGKALKEYEGYEEPTSLNHIVAMYGAAGVEGYDGSTILDEYEFTHWEDAEGNKYTRDTTVVGDIDLKACYKEKTKEEVLDKVYTIDVHNDGTKGIYDGPTTFGLKIGSNILASMSEAGVVGPSLTSGLYKFLGWAWTGSSDIIKDDELYTDITKNSITAVYVSNTVKVTLSAGIGSFAGDYKYKVFSSDPYYALNTIIGYEEPTHDTYTFSRWVDEKETEVANDTLIMSDITLFARFVDGDGNEIVDTTVYTIDVHNDDTKGTYDGPTTFDVKIGSNILASMSEAGVVDPVANDKYTFLGWSWTGDEAGIIKENEYYVDGTLNRVTAVYRENVIKVVLSAGDGEFAGGAKTKTIESNEEVALGEYAEYEEPTKADYEFMRWVDARGVEVSTSSVIKANTVLFARFKRVGQVITDGKYIITIDNDNTKGVIKVNGGVKDPVRFKIGIGQDILATIASESIIASPASTEYVFKGWSWSGDLDDIIKPGDVFDNPEYISLKAVYTNLSKFTVVLRANTGVFEQAKSRKIVFETDNREERALENYSKYEVPVKAGATFNYWLELNEDGTRASFSETSFVKRDLILDAIYKDDKTGEDIGKNEDGTDDGGDNATYTVTVKNDVLKGTMSNSVRKTIDGKEYETALLEFKLGDIILDKIEEKSLEVDPFIGYTFEGWSEKNNEDELFSYDDAFTNKEMTEIYATYYQVFSVHVILNANTGFFKNYQRTKNLEIHRKMTLGEVVNYEEPIKSDGYTFTRWEDSTGNVYPTTYVFGKELDGQDIELFAIYTDAKGNVVGKGETKDGGARANYTMVGKYDITLSSVSEAADPSAKGQILFEIVKDGLIKQAMIDYNVYEPTKEAEDWWLKGWSFVPGHTDDLIDLFNDTTQYTDTTKTIVYAKYVNVSEWGITLHAKTGLFSDNTRVKKLTNKERIAVKDFPGYEKPAKSDGYKFDRWELADGTVFKDTDKPTDFDPTVFVLYAIYKDDKGNDIDKGGTIEHDATYTIRLSSDDTKGTLGVKKSFEIRLGDYILATMSNAGIKDPVTKIDPVTGKQNYFVGWSWASPSNASAYDLAVLPENIYKGNEGTILYALYSQELMNVTLEANTGLFSNDAREKSLTVPQYQLLKAAKGYEEPVKANTEFSRWYNGEKKQDILNLNSYKVVESQTLTAIYASGSNVIGKEDDGTNDGGENATYTIKIKNSSSQGTYDGAQYFEIKKGGVIYSTMKAQGVKEGTPLAGYAFKGWKLGSKLISATTTYEDTNLTYMTLEYNTQTTDITFDATLGAFADGSREKSYVVARGRIINTIEGYEEPTKNKWSFSRWVDEDGKTVASSSEIEDHLSELTLKAMYFDRNGKEAGEDSHSHLICGETTEGGVNGHKTDVIGRHDTKVSYKPIASEEEFDKYINDELAKPEDERKDIKVYLEEDLTLTKDTAIDRNMNVYICLNGFTLYSKALGNIVDRSGNIYVTNCAEHEATIIGKATGSEVHEPLFGSNGIHVLSSKGRINLDVNRRLVDVANTASAISKDIELMNVSIECDENVLLTNFISAEGNSNVRLVDAKIGNVSVSDSLISTDDGAGLYIDSIVDIENNKTNRAIIDAKGTFEVAEGAVFKNSHNTIEKLGNGNTAVIFVGGDDNNIYGNLIVKDNKLLLSDEYKKLVKVEPVVVVEDDTDDTDDTNDTDDTTNPEEGTEFDETLGTYDEEPSPAGEVGYSAAVAFTKDNIGFNVRDAKIEICDNESVASYSDVKAGYMYQVRAKDNSVKPLVNQELGTTLDGDSVIEVSFDSQDGEGLLTDNIKIIENDVFTNKTFGKEQNILDIKENKDGILELRRKLYYVEYDEGAPTTNETKQVIKAFKRDGSTLSEATRVRTKPIKAGYNVSLEDDELYNALGFRLSTYSIAYKSNGNKALGDFAPKSTISYIDDIYGDGEGIKDGDVIKAKANWNEQALTSEARELIITQAMYDEMVNQAALDAVMDAASKSDITQIEEDKAENYYKVRYHLNGGHIFGTSVEEEREDYFEVTDIKRKNKYILVQDVEKVATESGVPKNYDFIGWSRVQGLESLSDSDRISEIEANYAGDEIIDVYAYYMPSTFKITYHFEGGYLDDYDGDSIEDTIVRIAPYRLLTGVKKENSIFTRWRVEGGASTEYASQFAAGHVKNDLDAYAEYESALYDVKYILNGGEIVGKTNYGDETFIDSTANIQKDYYLYTDVVKDDHKFTGWETAKGVKISKIDAGDTDVNKREVIATFAPTTWQIIYDADGGNIVGIKDESYQEKLSIDQPYMLYTDVEKEGYEFEYWYDINTNEKIDIINSARGGAVYRVRAKWRLATYNLKLHLDDVITIDLNNISTKTAYVLPINYTKENFEFLNWYYKNDAGEEVIINTIPAGNPKNITDLYANLDDLMTHKIVYHLGLGESIDGITSYDAGSTEDNKTVTIKKNRREYTQLPKNVTKEGYKFIGWTSIYHSEGYFEVDIERYGELMSYAEGYSKNFETNYSWVVDTRNTVFNFWPNFIRDEEQKVEVVYHIVGGDAEIARGEKIDDNTYVEEIIPKADIDLGYYAGAQNRWTFLSLYYSEEEATAPYDYSDNCRIEYEKLMENIGGRLDVYLRFEKNYYRVNYNFEGGTLEGVVMPEGSDGYELEYLPRDGDSNVLTGVKRDGYEFGGWFTEPGGEGHQVEHANRNNGEREYDLYAYWKKIKYEVLYDLGGGKLIGKAGNSYAVTYSRLEDNDVLTGVEYEDHVFDGWYTAENGQGTRYDKLPSSDEEIEDFTLYANYFNTTFTITYQLNGGSLKGKLLNAEGAYVEQYNNNAKVELIPKSEIIYEGGVFTGWVDEDGKKYDIINEGHEGDLVLTATYSTETTKITFNISDKGIADGKITQNGKFVETYNVAEDMVMPTAIRWSVARQFRGGNTYEMMYFDGWYTSPNYQGSPVTTIPAGNPKNITELYAKWTNAAYVIYYNLNGGTIEGIARREETDSSSETMVVWDDYVLPTKVTHNYGEFGGWYDNNSFSGSPITKIPARSSLVKNGSITLYAKLPKVKYRATFYGQIKVGGYQSSISHSFNVENLATYVLDESYPSVTEFVKDDNTTRFDGWYKKENGEFVGDEIISFPKNYQEDPTLYAKFIDISTLDEEEMTAYEERVAKRAELRAAAKATRQKEINDNAKSEGDKTKSNLKPGQSNFYSLFGDIAEQDKQDAIKKREEAAKKENAVESNGLFGALREFAVAFGELLLGDDGDDDDDTPVIASPNEIQVSISDLLAYDTISTKNLGITVPSDKVLDSVVVTYIMDQSGNFIDDYDFIGTVIPAGSNAAEVAGKYPDSILGVRAIIIDKSIVAQPRNYRPTYYGGGGYSGGGGGGGGGGIGGSLPVSANKIIVNPYGYDGRGADNGALRAGLLKLQVNTILGRVATPSFGTHKTINLVSGNKTAVSDTADTWEYFPASNAFKLFSTATNGDRYYFTNGWYKSTENSRETWYRFDADGIMQKGFVEENGKVYYLNNDLSQLAHMVTGFKDFVGTGYTGYFNKSGELISIFPTNARYAYENQLVALPTSPSFSRTTYEELKRVDTLSTKIVRTEKTHGQSQMGNFVGYWYYMASGAIKFRFETINRELQTARFADNGWINVYDEDHNMYSYRFDNSANLLVNIVTPEGIRIDNRGHMVGSNVLLNFKAVDEDMAKKYVLAVPTSNSLPINVTQILQSHLVTNEGIFIEESPATDLWTTIDLQGATPVLTNTVYTSKHSATTGVLQHLSNVAANVVKPISYMHNVVTQGEGNLNVADVTRVLSAVESKNVVRTFVRNATKHEMSTVHDVCSYLYDTVKKLFVA